MKTLILTILLFIVSIIHSKNYYTQDIITGLTQPVSFVILPNGYIIVTQHPGAVMVYDNNYNPIGMFWNFTDSNFYGGEMGTLGIALDPDYSVNKKIYIFDVKGDAINFYFRVYKFTENNYTGTNPTIIFEHYNPPGSSNTHAAGNLYFGKDNKLYLGIGTVETYCLTQSLNCPRGKILRINSDGSAPPDNPFYDDGNPATGNDDRIWALGLRNPFDFCVSPVNDSIYVGENGGGPDEINFIRKGKNYGYPVCSGICGNPLYKDPILQLPNSTVPTGIIVYSGSQFPQLYNKLLVASFSTNRIYSCELGNPPNYDTIVSFTSIINFPSPFAPTAMRQGNDGIIYLASWGFGKIIKITPQPNSISNQNLTGSYTLSQNYPNPFNPVTSVKYEIPKISFVSLKIYNVLGVEVASLVNETKQQGSYKAVWDASQFPSGVYFYEMTAGDFKERRKMVLVK